MDNDEIRNGVAYGQKILSFINKDKGYHLAFDGFIKPKQDQSQLVVGFPWIYLNGAGKMKCPTWQSLHFGTFNIVPEYCQMFCWKLVIIPKDVAGLFKTEEILNSFNLESKLGLDLRTYTFGMYKAFGYFTTKEEAKRIETTIKRKVNTRKYFYDIFVKKGCTEFENRAPSNVWITSNGQKEFEDALDATVLSNNEMDYDTDVKEPNFLQPSWAKHIIRLFWTQSGYASGDHSWKKTPYSKLISTSRDPVRY